MGEELARNFEAEIELIAGSGGIFEVAVNGNEIFSKKKRGHIPTFDELCVLIPKT